MLLIDFHNWEKLPRPLEMVTIEILDNVRYVTVPKKIQGVSIEIYSQYNKNKKTLSPRAVLDRSGRGNRNRFYVLGNLIYIKRKVCKGEELFKITLGEWGVKNIKMEKIENK